MDRRKGLGMISMTRFDRCGECGLVHGGFEQLYSMDFSETNSVNGRCRGTGNCQDELPLGESLILLDQLPKEMGDVVGDWHRCR